MDDEQARIEILKAEVEALRRAVERQRTLGRQSAKEAQDLAAKFRETRERLTKTRQDLRELRARRSVRIAMRASRLAVAIRRGIRRGRARSVRPTTGRAAHRPALLADERRFIDRATAPLCDPPPSAGPLVSIVMLNRDGAAHLQRCLPILAMTTYRDIELIVIDNASTDESLAILDAYRPSFPVHVIRNAENTTFSAGNDQGIAEARGDHVLFLNNDIEPINPDWLGFLVATIQAPGVVAAGSRLIYPRRVDPVAGAQFADLSLQHGGVAFGMVDGAPLPVPLGAGEDPLSEWATAVREVPALTAACLLVRRAALDVVGGFTGGYVYGQEDVDLCLKLRDQGGRLMYDGRSALWHHESSTRNLEEPAARRARSRANRERFVGHWGPRLYRTVLADALDGGRFWRPDPFHLSIVGSVASRPEIERAGWRISAATGSSSDDEAAPDAVLVVDPTIERRTVPASAIRIVFIDGELDRWLAEPGLDDADIVLVADADTASAIRARTRKVATEVFGPLDADSLAAAVHAWLSARRVGIRIAVPSWEVAPGWGDLHFARDIQRALERAGFPTRIHLRPDWDGWPAARDDIGLHLLGREVAGKRPGRLEVLWHISHPDAASVERYEAHDLAFVASDSFAVWMDGQTAIPVRPLHQATDPERFAPGSDGPHHELLFVANSRGVRRHVLGDLLPTTHDLAVYGKGWTPERLDPQYLAGLNIPNHLLPGYYASADIVLNDHWPDMQREGFISNRLYDVTAAGAFVISDDIEGLEEEFDHGVVAYQGRQELHALIDQFLEDPAARREHATRARAAVLANHTFAYRVEAFLAVIEPTLVSRPARFESTADDVLASAAR